MYPISLSFTEPQRMHKEDSKFYCSSSTLLIWKQLSNDFASVNEAYNNLKLAGNCFQVRQSHETTYGQKYTFTVLFQRCIDWYHWHFYEDPCTEKWTMWTQWKAQKPMKSVLYWVYILLNTVHHISVFCCGRMRSFMAGWIGLWSSLSGQPSICISLWQRQNQKDASQAPYSLPSKWKHPAKMESESGIKQYSTFAQPALNVTSCHCCESSVNVLKYNFLCKCQVSLLWNSVFHEASSGFLTTS